MVFDSVAIVSICALIGLPTIVSFLLSNNIYFGKIKNWTDIFNHQIYHQDLLWFFVILATI